eukprot:gene20249-20821_t
MRPEDIDEVRASSGLSPEVALRIGFGFSAAPLTLADPATGVPIGIMGVVPEDGLVGRIWMLGTPMIGALGLSFLRRNRLVIDGLNTVYPILTNMVDERNEVHIKWLKWLGFTFIRRHPAHGAERRPFIEFVRILNEQQFQLQQQQYAQNKASAITAFQDKQVALNTRLSQEQTTAATETENVNLQAQRAESTAITAAGESGVSGMSVDALVGDIEGRTGRYADNVKTNLDWTNSQIADEKKATSSQAVDRINSVNPGVAPSFLDAGLRIGTAAVNANSQYNRLNAVGY